jgi:hypothetical protein
MMKMKLTKRLMDATNEQGGKFRVRSFIGCRSVMAAALISACLASPPAQAKSTDYCNEFRASVSLGKWLGPYKHKQQMIVSSTASPGPKALRDHDGALVRVLIEFDYDRPGSTFGTEDGQIQLEVPWGSFSRATEVFSPGPATDVRVRNAFCLASTY